MKTLLKLGAAGYLAYWLISKGSNAYNAYQKIEAKITGARNVKVSLTRITIDIDTTLYNPTDKDFTMQTNGLLTVKKVHLYSENMTYIGTATPPPVSISLPAKASQTIKDIPAQIETQSVLEMITHPENLKNLITKVEFEALGQSFII